jgi:hypothetical protein
MENGRRTRIKSKPSKYFELAAPIIKAKARMTPDFARTLRRVSDDGINSEGCQS